MPTRKARDDLVPLIIADVYELAGLFRRNGETIARRAGQTQARWQVLSAASDTAKTVPQIARRLGVSRQNVQRIADLLAQEGLARFTANPDHQASPHLVLSDAGRRLLAQLTRAAGLWHEALAGRLKDAELGALRRNLGSLRAALQSLDRSTTKESDDD
jgi:DNA-binding MarR family transcriptional regulator